MKSYGSSVTLKSKNGLHSGFIENGTFGWKYM